MQGSPEVPAEIRSNFEAGRRANNLAAPHPKEDNKKMGSTKVEIIKRDWKADTNLWSNLEWRKIQKEKEGGERTQFT